jgi:hypothetical protein
MTPKVHEGVSCYDTRWRGEKMRGGSDKKCDTKRNTRLRERKKGREVGSAREYTHARKVDDEDNKMKEICIV